MSAATPLSLVNLPVLALVLFRSWRAPAGYHPIRVGRRVTQLCLAVSSGLALTACEDRAPLDVVHPAADSLEAAAGPSVAVYRDKRALAEGPELLSRFAASYAGRRVVATVPLSVGAPLLIDARQWDATRLPDGSFAVLQAQLLTLAVYDSTGAVLKTLTTFDSLPVPIEAPMRLFHMGNDLWLADQRGGLIPMVGAGRDLGQAGTSVPVGMPFRDACAIGGDLYVHVTDRRPEVIRRVGPGQGGAGSDAFGTPYRYAPSVAARRIRQGKIACVDSEGMIVAALDFVSRVTGYSVSDGMARWLVTFPDLSPPRITATSDGHRVRTALSAGISTHTLARVTSGRDQPVVVQYARADNRLPPEAFGRDYTLDTFLLDPGSGEGVYWGDDIPEILSLQGEYVISLHRRPKAFVELARLEG